MVEYMRLHLGCVPLNPLELRPPLARVPEIASILRGCIVSRREDRFKSSASLLGAIRALRQGLASGEMPELELPAGAKLPWTSIPEETLEGSSWEMGPVNSPVALAGSGSSLDLEEDRSVAVDETLGYAETSGGP